MRWIITFDYMGGCLGLGENADGIPDRAEPEQPAASCVLKAVAETLTPIGGTVLNLSSSPGIAMRDAVGWLTVGQTRVPNGASSCLSGFDKTARAQPPTPRGVSGPFAWAAKSRSPGVRPARRAVRDSAAAVKMV